MMTTSTPTTPPINTREYASNHGARPRGRGRWAFCPATAYNGGIDYLAHVVVFVGTFTDAARRARRHFAAGVPLVVCP